MRQGKDKLRRFFQTGYQAKSWSRERKIIARVEATSTRAAERWRAIKITDFERRQMAALRKELDHEYKVQDRSSNPNTTAQ